MNRFRKYCPNVWIAECDEEYEKGIVLGILKELDEPQANSQINFNCR